MHPLTITFATFTRQLAASHLRLLIAGLLAIALISAALTLAAGPDPAKDEISITTPTANAVEREDFPVQVKFKPKEGRQSFNTQVYIDGHLVDVRTSKGKKFDGKESVQYDFQYGDTRSGEDSRTNLRFNRQLLRPGQHVVKVVVRQNIQPSAAAGSAIVSEASQTFSVANVKSLTTSQEEPITIKARDLAKKPVTERNDNRIVRQQAQTTTGSVASPNTIANSLGAKNLLSPFVQTAKAHSGDHANLRLITTVDSNGDGRADARLGNTEFWIDKVSSNMNCHGYPVDGNNTIRVTTPAGGGNIGETLLQNCPTFLPNNNTVAGPGMIYAVRLIMPDGYRMRAIDPRNLMSGLTRDYQPNPPGQRGPRIEFYLQRNITVELHWMIEKIPPPPAPPAPPALPSNIASCSNGAAPFYRLNKIAGPDGDHFYTMSGEERNNAITQFGYMYEGVAGFLFPNQAAGTVPLYRLWSGPAMDHFYTISADERDNAVKVHGYTYEGVAGYMHPGQAPHTGPLYRSNKQEASDHFYTMSAEERDSAARGGWAYEGIAGYMFASCPPDKPAEPQAPADSDNDGVPDDKDACPNEPKGPDGSADGCPKLTAFDPNAPFLALTKVSATEVSVDAFALEFDGTRPNGAVKELRAIVDGKVTDTVQAEVAPVGTSNDAGTQDIESATVRNQTLQLGNVADGKPHTVALHAITESGNQGSVTFKTDPVAAQVPAPPNESTVVPEPVPAKGVDRAITNAEDDFSSLPKTGQAGLIAFIVFLIASGTYYGTQYYRERKAKRS